VQLPGMCSPESLRVVDVVCTHTAHFQTHLRCAAVCTAHRCTGQQNLIMLAVKSGPLSCCCTRRRMQGAQMRNTHQGDLEGRGYREGGAAERWCLPGPALARVYWRGPVYTRGGRGFICACSPAACAWHAAGAHFCDVQLLHQEPSEAKYMLLLCFLARIVVWPLLWHS
jgi:hypothetical protein